VHHFVFVPGLVGESVEAAVLPARAPFSLGGAARNVEGAQRLLVVEPVFAVAEDRAVINDLIAAHARIADLSDDRKIVPVRARTIVAIPEPLRDGYAFIEHIDGRELIAGV